MRSRKRLPKTPPPIARIGMAAWSKNGDIGRITDMSMRYAIVEFTTSRGETDVDAILWDNLALVGARPDHAEIRRKAKRR